MLTMQMLGSLAVMGALAGAVSAASGNYSIKTRYDTGNFFHEFDFFGGEDPTHGFVVYQDAATANASGLAGYHQGRQIYLGTDHSTVLNASDKGRSSVRVTSKQTFSHGLFIADIAHQPGGICGVWGAFWTVGLGSSTADQWPALGEIDIIENVNAANTSTSTLHTSSGCSMSQGDCNKDSGMVGCGQPTEDRTNYGVGFNTIGGGVYAMEWTSDAISVWFFPRDRIPADVGSDAPNPAGWTAPQARFVGNAGCDIDDHFADHRVVINTDFCGDWAGKTWAEDPLCAPKAATCNEYVAANPSAFSDAYWLINDIRIFER